MNRNMHQPKLTIFRDFGSIGFIRCVTPISGSDYFAEGAGFSFNKAIAKCLSERHEREFQLNQLKNGNVLGIAAHPNCRLAIDNARMEALESTALQQVAELKMVTGLRVLSTRKRVIYLSRVRHQNRRFWFCLIQSKFRDRTVYTHSVRPSPASALLKAWSEWRNIQFYQPAQDEIESYTKGNRLLRQVPAYARSLKARVIDLTSKAQTHQNPTHYIAYFLKGDSYA